MAGESSQHQYAIKRFYVVRDPSPLSVLIDIWYESDINHFVKVILGGGAQSMKENITIYPATPKGKQASLEDAHQRLAVRQQSEAGTTMKTEGYVITRSKHSKQYFTSESAYDRAEWVEVKEAAVYETADLASQAARKLWKAGEFSAKVIPLREITLDMEMPSEEKPEQEDKMVAAHQASPEEIDQERQGACPECGCEPCECDSDEMSSEKLPGEEMKEPGEEECEMTPGASPVTLVPSTVPDTEEDEKALTPVEAALAKGKRYPTVAPGTRMESKGEREFHTYEGWKKACKKANPDITFEGDKDICHAVILKDKRPVGGVGEWDGEKGVVYAKALKEGEFKMPKKGDDPAKPEDNDTTAANMKEPKHEELDFEDPASKADKPETDLSYATAMQHDDKVNVPAEIKQQLKDAIAEFKKGADYNNVRDDARASFMMTVHDALQMLLDDLDAGTVEGIKQAQIHYSSFMNPITTHIPPEVRKYIERGGRKASLKDLFDVKWDQVRRQNKI